MEALILKLITMSLQASIAIGAVVLVRYIFGLLKIPKKYAYLLWIIPFIRLCIPFAIESQLSVMPESFSFMESEAGENGDVKIIDNNDINGNGYPNDYELQYYHNANESDDFQYSDEYYEEYNYILESNGLGGEVNYSEDAYNQSYNGNDSTTIISHDTYPEYTPNSSGAHNLDSTEKASTYPSWTKHACIIWYIGVAGFIIYSYISYIRLRKRLEAKVLLEGNVYISDYIDTGFVIGAFKPYICIPSDLDKEKQEYVIAHENYHIRRRDYIAKTIYFIITVIHWFNPFVWMAYFLMERDMEMSCDEAVLYELGMDSRNDYANTLLFMATDRRNPISMPIAFGEGSTKGRINNIMKSKKPVVVLVVVAVVVIAVLSVVLLTNPSNKDNSKKDENNSVATETDANLATDSNGEDSGDMDTIHQNESDNAEIDVTENDSKNILKFGHYRYVPEGESLEEAMLYAPDISINTYLHEISIIHGLVSAYIPYGKYEVDETNEHLIFLDGDNKYCFEIREDCLVLLEASSDISYLKEDNGEYFNVPIGGVFELVPDSLSDMDYLYDGYSHDDFGGECPEAVKIEIIQPELELNKGLGADGPILDFADMKFIIFHGYGALYVYDRAVGGIRGAINLEAIGMNYTQGDNTCFVSVGNNGYRVYLKTMSSNIAYVYDVQYNQLYQVDKTYVDAQKSVTLSLVTDEIVGDDYTTWQSYNCEKIIDGQNIYYGYLFSGSGLWQDVTFAEENEGGVRRINLLNDYYNYISGEERKARLEAVKEVRDINIEMEKIENQLNNPENQDNSAYDNILEMHKIAKGEAWDKEIMEENGLASDSNGGIYSGYAYLDITGDGVDELILGYTTDNASVILAAYTIYENEVEILLSGHERSYYCLCEDNVIKHHWSNNASNSGTELFYIGADGVITYLEGIVVDGNYSGKHLWYYSTEYGKHYSYECKPVTYEYAMEVLYEYNSVDIDYTYLEAPEVSSTIPYFSPEEDEAKHAFGTMMEDWSSYPEVEEVMSGFYSAYCGYYDIDNDGVVELIINNEKCMGIFKYENSEIKRIYLGAYSGLLEDGTAMYYRPGGAPEHKDYKFYVYDGEEYVEKDSFEWYNNDDSGDYTMSEDDNYFHNGELITKDEWESLIAPYIELEFAKKENTFVINN